MKHIFKRSQAAMEFLMTYGWAILIVITVVSVLAYFGVLDMDRFLPGKCILPPGLSCLDFELYGKPGYDGVELAIKNSKGSTLVIKKIAIPAYGCSEEMNGGYGIMGKEEKIRFPVFSGCNFLGKEFISADIKFTFLNTNTGLTHTDIGNLKGNVRNEEFPLAFYETLSGDEKTCARAAYFDFCSELVYLDEGNFDDPLRCCVRYDKCC